MHDYNTNGSGNKHLRGQKNGDLFSIYDNYAENYDFLSIGM